MQNQCCDYLLTSLMIGAWVYSINSIFLSSFYPQYSLEYKGLSNGMVGIVFGAISIGLFISATSIQSLMIRPGAKRKLMIAGLTLSGLGNVLFIGLQWLDNVPAYFAISFILRLMVGIGGGFYMTCLYSMLPLLYPDALESKIAILEAVVGAGLSLGPFVGGILFKYGGQNFQFTLPFLFSGILTLIAVIIAYNTLVDDSNENKNQQLEQLVPKNINQNKEPDSENCQEIQQNPNTNQDVVSQNIVSHRSYSQNIQQDKENQDFDTTTEISVSYMEIFRNKYLFFDFFVIVLLMANFNFLDPTLGPFMLKEYNSSEAVVGSVFFVGAGTYILWTPIGGYVAKHSPSYKLLIVIGCAVTGIGNIIIGPNNLLTGLPDSLAFPYIGDILVSLGFIFVFIPVIPDFIDTFHRNYTGMPENVVANFSAALFNAAFSLGQLIGPIGGGYLTQYFKFQTASSAIGLLLIAFGCSYCIFGGAFTVKKYQQAEFPSMHRPRSLVSIPVSHLKEDLTKCDKKLALNEQETSVILVQPDKTQVGRVLLISRKSSRIIASYRSMSVFDQTQQCDYQPIKSKVVSQTHKQRMKESVSSE